MHAAAQAKQLSLRRFHTNQSLLIADGFVFHSLSLSLSVNFGGCFSETATVHHELRETSGLYSRCHGPATVWMAEKKNLLKQQKRHVQEHTDRQKKEDRQTWSRDRMKEKGHITVSKTKTPKTTLCQCPTSWKIHHYMKAKAFSLLSWSAQREVSQNIHLNGEKPIQTQPCWDR